MWWDWTQITLMDSVLFSIFTILVSYVVGFGVLKLVSVLGKTTDAFSSFDFLQKITFRVFFGFAFVILFAILFAIFNSFLIIIAAIIVATVSGLVISIRQFKVAKIKLSVRNFSFIATIVIVILLSIIFLSSALIAGFYGSTNDDAAFHTLVTRVILDNPNALLTRSAQPFPSFTLNYPSVTHVLCAFLSTTLSVPIQKIVIMVSAILPALIALAMYSTLECLFRNKLLSILGLIITGFFAIGLSWIPLSWGGLPFLLSLFISISGMGLIFVFLLKEKITVLSASLIGLIFFIALQAYPVALLITSLWFLLILCIKLLPRLWDSCNWRLSREYFRKSLSMVLAFLTPLFFGIPYLYYLYTHYYIGNYLVSSVNLGPSTDIYAEVVGARIDFNWLFNIPMLSSFFSDFGKLFALAPYSLLLLIVFIPQINRRLASIFPAKKIASGVSIVYAFMLILMAYLTLTIVLPINLLLSILNSERVWQHLFIVGTILTTVVVFSAIYFTYLPLKRLFYSKNTNSVKLAKFNKNKVAACTLAGLLIFSAFFFLIPVISEQQALYTKTESQLNTYNTLSQSDLSLMKWIIDNTPANARILVSSGDSGQYVTAVTQRQSIFRYSYLQNYTDLMELLTANASDIKAVPFMIEYNVSYVYIGSIASTFDLQDVYYRHFNATQFLATPYFTLTKEFGDAWLFQFNASAALTAYNTYGATD